MISFRQPLGLVIAFALGIVLLLLDDLFARPVAFITGIGFDAIKQAEVAFLLIVGALIVARFVRRDIVHGVLAARAGKALPNVLGDIAALLVLVVGAAFIATGVYGRDIGAIVATGGLSLAVIGIALRDVILSMFNAAALNMENAFAVGDRIKIGDVDGTVVQTTWRSTTILTPTSHLVAIPNVAVGVASITNFDRPDTREWRTVKVRLDYDVSVERAERILLAGILGASDVSFVDTPKVFATRLESDGVLYAVHFAIADHRQGGSADHAIIKGILAHLRDADVAVAYPKQEVFNADRRARVAERCFDRSALVQQSMVFRDLPLVVRERIANALIEWKVPAGTQLVGAGETRPSLFIVGEGLMVRMRARSDCLGFVEERYVATQIFGRRALLAALPHSAPVSALAHSLVFELTRAAFAEILAAHPEIKASLAANLALTRVYDADVAASGPTVLHAAAGNSELFYLGQLEAFEAAVRDSTPSDAQTLVTDERESIGGPPFH